MAAMFRLMPTGAESCVHATPRHLLHRGDNLRVLAGKTECHGAHQRSKCDRSRLAGESGQHAPRVARRLILRTWEGFIVVGAIEGVETERLGSRGNGTLLRVGEAHLPLDDDAQLHAATVARGDSGRDEGYDRCNVNHRDLRQRREAGGPHGSVTS